MQVNSMMRVTSENAVGSPVSPVSGDIPSWKSERHTKNHLFLTLAKTSEVKSVVGIVENSNTEWADGTSHSVFSDDDFPDSKYLEKWLSDHDINTFGWGVGKAKAITTLYNEINSRQSVLVQNEASGVIRRYVRVIRVKLKQSMGKQKDRYLIEGSQELGATGQIRFRNMLMSTKIKPGESVPVAAKRCAEKELQNIGSEGAKQWGVLQKHVTIPNRNDVQVAIEDEESPSFPGLVTRYVLFTVTVTLTKTLPRTPFCTVEYLQGSGHIAVKHHWKWRTLSEVDAIVQSRELNLPGNDKRQASLYNRISHSGMIDPLGIIVHDISESDFAKSGFISKSFIISKLKSWRFDQTEIDEITKELPDQVDLDTFVASIVPEVKQRTILIQSNVLKESLSMDHLKVLEKLFPGCCRVFVTILHGGFSGSLVLQVRSTGVGAGTSYDPTVVKLDTRNLMQQELERYREVSTYMGDCAPAILDTDVSPNGNPIGGLKFDMVGAVWMLPDFHDDSNSQNLLNTFKTLFVYELESEVRLYRAHLLGRLGKTSKITKEDTISESAPDEDSEIEIIREVFGEVRPVLKETFAEILRKMTLSSCEPVKLNLFQYYRLEHYINRNIFKDGGGDKKRSFLPNMDILDSDGAGRQVFREMMEKVKKHNLQIVKNEYLQGLRHGDLNGMNILIDSQDIVWVIDFAFSGMGHVIEDIIKLESCILFEYVILESDVEYKLMQHIVDALLDVNNLREKPHCPQVQLSKNLPHLELVWSSVETLRMYLSHYCSVDPEPMQMYIGMMHFALRALSFRDIKDKRLPFYVAVCCARKLSQSIDMQLRVNNPEIMKPVIAATLDDDFQVMNLHLTDEQVEYEKKRYFHDIFIKESFVMDMITRERVHVADQSVEIELLEGAVRDQVLEQQLDVDELQAQRRLQKRLDILQGVVQSKGMRGQGQLESAARFKTPMQVLGSMKSYSHRVILGGAASGKSCLMKKLLLSAIEEQVGSEDDIVPLLILLIDLGRLMTKNKLTSKDDLLDLYLESVYGQGSARIGFFRHVRKRGNLLLLLDGMDEAGDHKNEIEKYVSHLAEKRIIISSRMTGFSHGIFSFFTFFQVMPLTKKLQHQVIESRLGKSHPQISFIRKELNKPEYTVLVRNPLMLSLLISLLSKHSNSEDESEESLGYTRAYLYKHAVDQLLHQSTMAKFGMRRGDDDKQIEKMTTLLASQMCLDYLKQIAFYSHSMRIRDFSPALLTAVAEEHATNDCYHKTDEEVIELLYEIISVLQTAVFEGRCGLFALSKVAVENEKYNDEENFNYVMRYIHLSFQEYLAGLFLIDQLQHAMARDLKTAEFSDQFPMLQKTMTDLRMYCNSDSFTDGLLEDAWWRGVFLSMPGSMSQELFEAITSILLKNASESNLDLIYEMLAEMQGASPTFKARIEQQIKNRYDKSTSDVDDFEGLTHHSRNLQYLCLNQNRRFSDPVRVAYLVAFQKDQKIAEISIETSVIENLSWYQRASAARALGMLSEVKCHPAILKVLIHLWGDESTMVQRASVDAIKSLRSEHEPAVIQEVTRQLQDEIEQENGIDLLSALDIKHKDVVHVLLNHASRTDMEDFAAQAMGALKSMDADNDLLCILCDLMENHPALRRIAMEVVSHHRMLEHKRVIHVFKTWLQEEDFELALGACNAIVELKCSSPLLISTLQHVCESPIAPLQVGLAAIRAVVVIDRSMTLVAPSTLIQNLLKLAARASIDQQTIILRRLDSFICNNYHSPSPSDVLNAFLQKVIFAEDCSYPMEGRKLALRILVHLDPESQSSCSMKLLESPDAMEMGLGLVGTGYALHLYKNKQDDNTFLDKLLVLESIITRGRIDPVQLKEALFLYTSAVKQKVATKDDGEAPKRYLKLVSQLLELKDITVQKLNATTHMLKLYMAKLSEKWAPPILGELIEAYERVLQESNNAPEDLKSEMESFNKVVLEMIPMVVPEEAFDWTSYFYRLDSDAKTAILKFASVESLHSCLTYLLEILQDSNSSMQLRSQIIQYLDENSIWESEACQSCIEACVANEEDKRLTVTTIELIGRNNLVTSHLVWVILKVYTDLHAQGLVTILSSNNFSEKKNEHFSDSKRDMEIGAAAELDFQGKRKSSSHAFFGMIGEQKMLFLRLARAIERILLNADIDMSKEEILSMFSTSVEGRLFVCIMLTHVKWNKVDAHDVTQLLMAQFIQDNIEDSIVMDTLLGSFRHSIPYCKEIVDILWSEDQRKRMVGLRCVSCDSGNSKLSTILEQIATTDSSDEVRVLAMKALVTSHVALMQHPSTDENKAHIIASGEILEKMCVAIFGSNRQSLWSSLINLFQRIPVWPERVALKVLELVSEESISEDIQSIIIKHLTTAPGTCSQIELDTLMDIDIETSTNVFKIWVRLVQSRLDSDRLSKKMTKSLISKLVQKTQFIFQADIMFMKLQVLDLYTKFTIQVEPELFLYSLENTQSDKDMRTLLSKMLRFILIGIDFRISARILDILGVLVCRYVAMNYRVETELGVDCLNFFSQYQIKDAKEAMVFLDKMKDPAVRPFLFDPLLNFFRFQRANNPNPVNGWRIPLSLKSKINEIFTEMKSLEIMYLSKEMRENFELKEVQSTDITLISLRGQADIKMKRMQKQEQNLMLTEDWEVKRCGWFPKTPLDRKISYLPLAPGSEYQQSKITTYMARFYISNAQTMLEKGVLLNEIFPEINQRLVALGIRVEAQPFFPHMVSDGSLLLRNSCITSTSTKFRVANMMDMLQSCLPFCLCFISQPSKVNERTNKLHQEAVRERHKAIFQESFLPNQVICVAKLHMAKSDTSSNSSEGSKLSKLNSSSSLEEVERSLADEIAAIKKLPYSRIINYTPMMELKNSIIDEIVQVLVQEFYSDPALRVYRGVATTTSNDLSTIDYNSLPFSIEEERRFHERFLVEHSVIYPTRNDTRCLDHHPGCRKTSFESINENLFQDVSADSRIRQERRAVPNAALRTPDAQIGNEVIVVSGSIGSGKSTFLASFSDLFRKTISNSTPLLIFHACRGSPCGFDFKLSLLRIGTELLKAFPSKLDKFELQPPSGSFLNNHNVIKWWHNLLCQAGEAAMLHHIHPVIVIDDVFESNVDKNNWEMLLPTRYQMRSPPGITIVVSTFSSNTTWRNIQSKTSIDPSFSFREIPMNTISQSEQESLVENHFMHFGMQPSKPVIAALLDKSNSEHPAFIRTMCEEVIRRTSVQDDVRIKDAIEGFPDCVHGSDNGLTPYLLTLENEFGVDACGWALCGMAQAQFLDHMQLSQLLIKSSSHLSEEGFRKFCRLISPLVICIPINKRKHNQSKPVSKRHHMAFSDVEMVVDKIMYLKNKWIAEVIKNRYIHDKEVVNTETLQGYLFEMSLGALGFTGKGKIPMHLVHHVSQLFSYATESDKPEEGIKRLLDIQILKDWMKTVSWEDPVEYILNQLNEALETSTENNLQELSSQIMSVMSFIRNHRADLESDLNVLDEL